MPSRHLPLNRDGAFETWKPFDPGVMIDTNPSFVRRNVDEAWVVFCRYGTRPEQWSGSIWAVRVDSDMRPLEAPINLLANGSDPRVIQLGDGLLLFFVIPERDGDGVVIGSSVAMAEFRVEGQVWTPIRSFGLPKNPVSGPARPDSSVEWEKNWVPFAIGNTQVGLIYSHDPWNVIVMNLDQDTVPGFKTLFTDTAVSWDFGPVRGGTPPLPYRDGSLISFFHSSQAVGSKTIDHVGACVFRSSAPFDCILQTQTPLLIAPYKRSADRFGWNSSACVISPLGAEKIDGGYRLLCGIDDGEIASFVLSETDVTERLTPRRPPSRGAFHDYRGKKSSTLSLERILYVPEPVGGIAELPMIDFTKIIAGSGRTFVDVGAHIGFYTIALASGYKKVLAFEPSKFQFRWLQYNKFINSLDHVELRSSALGAQPGVSTINVLSKDGGVNSFAEDVVSHLPDSAILEKYDVDVEPLDSLGLDDVDFIKIDVEGFELDVLKGAVETIKVCRPAILIEVWTDEARRTKVASAVRAMNYTFEPMFPRSPELVLCLPVERRAEYEWFV